LRKRNLTVGLLGAAALAALIWAVVFAVPRLTGELAGTNVPAGRLAATPTVINSNLVWASAPGTVGSWLTTSAVFGNDGFIYALSTAPGVREIQFGVPVAHAVYRSQDGMEWSNELLAGFGDELFPRDIAFSGPNLYLVGTAPSAADPSRVAVRVGNSGDAGRTWASVDLDLVNDVGDAARGSAGSILVDIAANGGGALVGATSGPRFDNINPSNVALYFGADLLDLQLRATPFADGYSLDRLAATEDSFYAMVRPAGANLLELWRSPDGLEWERLDNFPFIDTVSAFGEIRERIAVVGQLEGTLVVGATLDGAVWDEVDLADLVPPVIAGNQWISAAGIGPAGLYLNVQTWFPDNGPNGGREVVQLIETADLINWSSIPTGSIAQGFVDQLVVAEDFVFVNAATGLVAGRVHMIGTRE